MEENTNNTPIQEPEIVVENNQNSNPQNNNAGANNQNNANKASLGGAAKGCFGLSRAAILGIIALIVLFFWGRSNYNEFVDKNEVVNEKWSQVQNRYQERADKYKNLPTVVKQAATHERETQQGVTDARAGKTKAQQDADEKVQAVVNQADSLEKIKPNINDEKATNKYIAAQDKLQEQMQIAINVVHEAYPDLKVNENFLALQAEIEGCENRVSTARHDFITSAQDYNRTIKHFPANLIAKMFGFNEREYYSAQEGAEVSPEIKF